MIYVRLKKGENNEKKSAEMEKFINQKANPCNDFYSFFCGDYDRINSAISMQVSRTGVLETLTNGVNRNILKMFNAGHNRRDTPEDVQVKLFYESCLRIKELSSTYSEKFKELVDEFGTMQVLEGSS